MHGLSSIHDDPVAVYMLHLPELGMTGPLGPPSPFFRPPPPPSGCLTFQCSTAHWSAFSVWSPLSSSLLGHAGPARASLQHPM